MNINYILSEIKVPNANDNIVSTIDNNQIPSPSGIQKSLLHQEQSNAPKLVGIDETSCQHQLSFNFVNAEVEY